jgi:hypothetical protein
MVSLFVSCLSVFILVWRGSKENGSCQEKKQMAGSLVLDPLARGPTSFANFSPLMMSFDALVYGGS